MRRKDFRRPTATFWKEPNTRAYTPGRIPDLYPPKLCEREIHIQRIRTWPNRNKSVYRHIPLGTLHYDASHARYTRSKGHVVAARPEADSLRFRYRVLGISPAEVWATERLLRLGHL